MGHAAVWLVALAAVLAVFNLIGWLGYTLLGKPISIALIVGILSPVAALATYLLMYALSKEGHHCVEVRPARWWDIRTWDVSCIPLLMGQNKTLGIRTWMCDRCGRSWTTYPNTED
jgi:hypothetical protein